MTVGDRDCCSRQLCGHGEVYHNLKGGTRYGSCGLCGCRGFAPPVEVQGKLILITQKFWYNFEDQGFKNDPVGWRRVTYVDVDGPVNIIVKPKAPKGKKFDRFIIGRNYIRERGALDKPQEATS